MRRMSDRIAVAGKFVITIGQVDSKEPDFPTEKILQLVEIMLSPFCNELSHFNLNWHWCMRAREEFGWAYQNAAACSVEYLDWLQLFVFDVEVSSLLSLLTHHCYGSLGLKLMDDWDSSSAVCQDGVELVPARAWVVVGYAPSVPGPPLRLMCLQDLQASWPAH